MGTINVKLNIPAGQTFAGGWSERKMAEVVLVARQMFPELPRINFGGDCSGNCYFKYKTKTTRDQLLSAIKTVNDVDVVN